jgi:hypothetical protein
LLALPKVLRDNKGCLGQLHPQLHQEFLGDGSGYLPKKKAGDILTYAENL